MRRNRVAISVAMVLVASLAFAQGPATAQIQAALRAFLLEPHTWTMTQTFTDVVVSGTCMGCDSGGAFPSLVQGDTIYASGVNTANTLAKSTAATRYFANTGTNNNPAWAQVNLANGVTGTLPVANGGSGSTTLGSDTQVCFLDGTVIKCGDAGLIYNKTTDMLQVVTVGPDMDLGIGLSVRNSTFTADPALGMQMLQEVDGTGYLQVSDYTTYLALNQDGSISASGAFTAGGATDNTHNFGLTVGASVSADGLNELGGVGSVIDSNGKDNTLDLYAFWGSPRATGDSVLAKLTGFYLQPWVNDTAVVTNVFGSYFNPQAKAAGATITNAFAFYASDLVGYGSHPYFLWYDGTGTNAGVFRVNELGILALYNPTFTAYTPGAVNFERNVFQWGLTGTLGTTNRGLIGMEAGGTGTARGLDLMGANLSFVSTLTPEVTDTSANSCGSGTQTIVGNDNVGKVTVIGSVGTSCTVTFATAFTNAPSCSASNETTAALARATSTQTTVVLAGTFLQNDVIAYSCLGR